MNFRGDSAKAAAGVLPGILALGLLFSAVAQRPPPPRRTPDGPWNHQIHFATSDDSLRWRADQWPIMTQASVPDIIELSRRSPAGPRGALLVYTVDARETKSQRGERLSRLVSTDGGNSWGPPETISLDRKPGEGNTVDPSVVELDDGRLRLYFYLMKKGPPKPGEMHRFYSAVSRDGLRFELEEGVRFEAPRVTDPEVVRAGNEWLMFLTRRGEVLLARSRDGLTFQQQEDFRISKGGIPGALPLDANTVRVYLTGRPGITSAVYNIETGRLEPDAGSRIRLPSADPAVWPRRGGGYVMIFKTWMEVPKKGR
ncbi:MAG: exo-alpha-sialidase [bacterium]|nr:exo-alpha-sialidase [bacterium]